MSAVIPFAFEDSLVRAVWRNDDPWFVAADACRALKLSNPSMAIKALDEDERAKFNLGRQGEATIVSEGGLYTLILRCRDATKPGTVPHRFRRWVTGEVLPSLRRTGQYAMPGAAPQAAPDADIRLREWHEKMIGRAERVFGKAAARTLWVEFGYPDYSPLLPASGEPDDDGEAAEDAADTLRAFLRERAAGIVPAETAGATATWGRRGVVGFRHKGGDILLPRDTWDAVMAAHGPRDAARALAVAGWLVKDRENRLASVSRVGGRALRVHRIRAGFLADA